MKDRILSVIIPVYNEVNTVTSVIETVEQVDVAPFRKQIIVVDDGSSDGTREILSQFGAAHPGVIVIFHDRNKGKGAALRTGFASAQGEAVIIQDADMEYDPNDWRKMLPFLLRGEADVVYGSRFRGGGTNWVWSHWLGNRMLSLITSLLYGRWVTDMETCYKLIKKDILNKVSLRANRFDFEPEITAKILKQGVRFKEVAISYRGRSFTEGKKICWRDAFAACWTLLKYRFID
ncbi:MAG: glycosyltransferase family 2 protein [Bacillota bacterium]